MTLRILTFNWHEGYIYLLSKTGHLFDVVERDKGGYSGWMYQFRPLPENLRLIRSEDAIKGLAEGVYDLALCHNPRDLFDLYGRGIPKILVFHTKPTTLFDAQKRRILREEYLASISSLLGPDERVVPVFVSERKRQMWGLEGRVIIPGIDIDEFYRYTGQKPVVLRVGHFLRERDIAHGFKSDLEDILKGIRVETIGINPSEREARISAGFEDLKRLYSESRIFFCTLYEDYDDGYNLSMLEAMATGMPVVSVANTTSPISDGLNGFISGKPEYLRRAIEMLLEDIDLAKAIGEKGRETVREKFPIGRFVEAWNDLFLQVEKKRAGRRPAEPGPRGGSPRIYDCFIFNNELDLLEMRLNILDKVVDRFVLVEATRTFSGKRKDLIFQQNRDRFKRFLDRIIHVVVDDMPDGPDRWKREWHQRNAIMRGLGDASSDDIILISDVDEIPNPEKITPSMTEYPKSLRQGLFYYYLNMRASREWVGTVVLRYGQLDTPQKMRDRRGKLSSIGNGGWHFSYLGDPEQIANKISSFAHAEFDTPCFKERRRISEKMARGEDLFGRDILFSLVEIDRSFPEYIRNNTERFKSYIKRAEPEGDLKGEETFPNDSLFSKNLKALRRTDPGLAERLLQAERLGDASVVKTPGGEKTVKVRGVSLHSRYRPIEESRQWMEKHLPDLKDRGAVYVLGFGFGYHIERLMEATDAEIMVIEPSLGLLKEALIQRELEDLLGKVRIITDLQIPPCRMDFAILEHSPSVRLNQGFFEEAKRRLLIARKAVKGMRICLVGPIYGGSLPVTEYCASALRKLGHSVEYIDNSIYKDIFLGIETLSEKPVVVNELRKRFVDFVSATIMARCEEAGPDLLIALAQAPLQREALLRMRSIGLRTAFWFVENYRHMTYWREIHSLYDYFFVIQRGDFLEEIERAGSYAHYLPLAASTAHHRVVDLTDEERREYGSQISFVGAGYRNRREFFLGLVDLDLKIWGNEWDLKSPLKRCIQREGARVGIEEMVKIFNASSINLNLHSSSVHNGPEPDGDFVNPRTFEIPACGGFQLVDERKLLPELFKVGEEVICFSEVDDLRKKIRYYLDHPDEREDIARAAMERVLREHTYEERMKEMIEFIVHRGFESPNWTTGKIDLDDLIDRARDLPELKGFLDGIRDSGEMERSVAGIEDLASGIKIGERELSETEKLILLMNQMKSQYLLKE
jgi:spore maturation protein CgeB